MIKIVERKDIKTIKEIGSGENSRVYITADGSVLKIFNPFIFMLYSLSGTSLEEKILNSSPVSGVPEIVTPTSAVYDNSKFVGYTMDFVKGKSSNEIDDNLTISQRSNLSMYARMHHRLEDLVKRGNDKGIVFPDLATCDNIIIRNDGSIRLIDYDGLQVGKYKTVCISTNLGDNSQYMIPKYQKDFLFNPNLDKKSLINLYFLDAFNINLEMVGRYNPYTGGNVTLSDVFEQIGLDDYDVQHKVWKCFQNDVDNDFLGSDVDRIADKYNLGVFAISNQGPFIKRLIRK